MNSANAPRSTESDMRGIACIALSSLENTSESPAESMKSLDGTARALLNP